MVRRADGASSVIAECRCERGEMSTAGRESCHSFRTFALFTLAGIASAVSVLARRTRHAQPHLAQPQHRNNPLSTSPSIPKPESLPKLLLQGLRRLLLQLWLITFLLTFLVLFPSDPLFFERNCRCHPFQHRRNPMEGSKNCWESLETNLTNCSTFLCFSETICKEVISELWAPGREGEIFHLRYDEPQHCKPSSGPPCTPPSSSLRAGVESCSSTSEGGGALPPCTPPSSSLRAESRVARLLARAGSLPPLHPPELKFAGRSRELKCSALPVLKPQYLRIIGVLR